MATKTFQADSMIEALKQVQTEMGPDAIVLSVRDIPLGPAWQVWKKVGVEVMAVTPETTNVPAARVDPPASIAGTGRSSGVEKQVSSEDPSSAEEMPLIEWEELNSTTARRGRPDVGIRYGAKEIAQPGGQPGSPPNKGRSWQPQIIQRSGQEPAAQPPVMTAAVLSPATAEVDANESPVFHSENITAELPRKIEARPVTGKTGQLPLLPPTAFQTTRPAVSPAPVIQNGPLPAGLAALQRQLLLQGVEQELVDRLMQGAASMLPASAIGDEAACRGYISQQLEADIPVQPRPIVENGRQVLALVGSSGSGKTSTVAKLAYFYQNVLHRPVMWISADTVRMGAIAETRAYTEAIGVPLRLVYTPDDLPEVMEEARSANVVLVDTPGFNPYREAQLAELGEILTNIPERATYLVASATTKEADLIQSHAVAGLYSLKGLVITRLDETFTFGSVYNLARKAQAPLAFFCSGSQANGSLQVAEAGRLVSALFGKGWLK
jgi:flagellar biosynthesis protein FlhF